MAIPLIASDVITILDSYAKELAAAYPGLGLGLVGETGTAAAAAINSKAAILGGVGNDGVTLYPGIRNNDLKAALALPLDAGIQQLRYDAVFQRIGRSPSGTLDAQVLTSLPLGWVMSSAAGLHYLNNWMLRVNAAHSGVPATPAAAGVLTATSTAAGAMPLTSAAAAPRVLHTLVGANEWDESLPSAEATQTALSGANNGYTYQIAGLVPAGVTAVKIYRSLFSGVGAPYGYDQKIPVIAGAAFPAIVLAQSDPFLLMNWNPPAWLSCLIRPEAAALIALAYSLAGLKGVQSGVPLSLLANNMVNPANVALGPANAFLGLGNPVQGAQFGSHTLPGVFVPGAISAANNAATGVQGFAGATGLRARVTTPLDVAGTISASYSYYDAPNGFGVVRTATTAAIAFSGTAVGSVANVVIPAGQLVVGVSADTPTGQAAGSWIWEATSVRP